MIYIPNHQENLKPDILKTDFVLYFLNTALFCIMGLLVSDYNNFTLPLVAAVKKCEYSFECKVISIDN